MDTGRLAYHALLIVDGHGWSARWIGRRGEEQSRPPHNTPKARGPPRKSREASEIGKKQVPTGGEAPSLYHSSLGFTRFQVSYVSIFNFKFRNSIGVSQNSNVWLVNSKLHKLNWQTTRDYFAIFSLRRTNVWIRHHHQSPLRFSHHSSSLDFLPSAIRW